MFLRLCILTLACSGNSKSYLSLTLFMNPLLHSSSSIFTSFIFISVVQSMFFRTCVLALPPGLKISFSNRHALSTMFCVVLFCGNSISHRYLVLFINFLPFCLSSLFICTIFNFSSFVHSSLFMI